MTVLNWCHERVAADTEYDLTTPSNAWDDLTYARAGMRMASYTDYVELGFADQASDVWAHYRLQDVTNLSNMGDATDRGLIIFYDNAGVDVVALQVEFISSEFWFVVRINDSTQLTTGINAGALIADNAEHVIDMHCNVTTGVIDLYIDGSLQWSDTQSLSATEIAKVRFAGAGSSGGEYCEMLVCDEPTIGWRMAVKYPTGAGNYTAQASGLFSDIDEVDPDTADKLIFDTHSTRASFATNTPPSIPGGSEIKAIGIAWQAQKTATGPNTLTPFMRHTSTDYDGTPVALTSAWEKGKHTFTTNLDQTCEIGVLAETV